jgi:hypothetical protein
MLTVSEAQILAWVSPILWPFIRVLAMFSSLPVIAQRSVPARVRVALAFLIVICAQSGLPPMPVIPLDSPTAFLVLLQQVLIGLSLGFAVRIVFAAIELAGEIIGLQMGLNFAGFFDPARAHGVFAHGSAAGLGQRNLSAGLVDLIAPGGHAAVHQLGAGGDCPRGAAAFHLLNRLSHHPERGPAGHLSHAADDANPVRDLARTHDFALPVAAIHPPTKPLRIA